jgi:hypothetical protein
MGASEGIKLASFLDVAEGVQAGQFGIGGRSEINSLADLDPTYRRLMDEPVTQILGIVGPGGRANDSDVVRLRGRPDPVELRRAPRQDGLEP